MPPAVVIAKREFAAYFRSPIGYIVLGAFVALSGFLYFDRLFVNGDASMDLFFGNMPFLFLLFGPAIAMRLLAEERGSGTIELLLTMPVTDWQVVVGKYAAALALLVVGTLLTIPFAVTVSKLGPLDPGPVVGGYVGTILLGGMYLAVGLFASALTKNQIVAFVVGLVLCFALYLLGQFVPGSGQALGRVIEYATPQYHFRGITRGVVELKSVVYYVSTIALLLLLSVQVLESRKWR